jgi:signal transduction histidine kinase/DNA-binding NarL/FixJ family response regulator
MMWKSRITAVETPWTLLIIDDALADRAVYRRYLSQDPHQAYNVVEASYGQEGLDTCRCLKIDAILLDFQLPDLSGLQVLEVLQTHYPHIAVVMLTAHGDEQVAVCAMKAGAQDYLVKDRLRQDTLQRTIRNVVHQARLQQQLRQNQERQLLISQLALQIRQSLELSETLATAVTEIRRLLQCDRVFVYQFLEDMSGTIIAESVSTEALSILHQTVIDTYFQAHGAQDYCQGQKFILTDIDESQFEPCYLSMLKEFQVKAALVIPILIGGERQSPVRLWGLLVAHHCMAKRLWQSDEIEIMEALALQLSIAIRHAELLAKTQAALAQEKALTTFKSQIISTVSHEYNSPLSAIQLAAETLQDSLEKLDPLTREQLFDIIQSKTKHLSSLVNDMLVVNRAELSRLELRPVAIDLEKLLSDLIAESQIVGTGQHTLTLKVRGDINDFIGDYGLLKQLFGNLLTNAIKYSPEGGRVSLQIMGDASQIICHIKDEGIGIPEADQQTLFQPFNRASNVGSINGTGLGLHIVKVSAELHGGTIRLESQAGQGTCVMVFLPKAPPDYRV